MKNSATDTFRGASLNKQILTLALPALGTLVAEPLFVLVDTAMVGHLGTAQLAGLGIASTIVTTLVALMVFLAYATTPVVARYLGAGRQREAVQAGIDGIYLAAAIGFIIAALLLLAPSALISFFVPVTSASGAAAHTYLTISAYGVPAMLLVFAASGLERGMQNTLTPLIISAIGFTVNAGLNAALIYGLGWGIAGSATGTVVAQWGMAVALLFATGRRVKAVRASWRPSLAGIKSSGSRGAWLFLRTVSLRICTVTAILTVTQHSATATAGFQIINSVFILLAFVFDSLAIACQALVGKTLGARDSLLTRKIVGKVTVWGAFFGLFMGALIAALSPFIGFLFTRDSDVMRVLPTAFLVLALAQPLCAVVFIFDGVLIGAGDNKYLGITGLVNMLAYLPAALLLTYNTDLSVGTYLALSVAALMGLYMLARLATLGYRIRGNSWLLTGA